MASLIFSLVASPITIRLALARGTGWWEVTGIYAGPFLAGVLAFTPPLIVDWRWPPFGAHPLAKGAAAAAFLVALYPLITQWLCPAESTQFLGHLRAPVKRFFTARGDAPGR